MDKVDNQQNFTFINDWVIADFWSQIKGAPQNLYVYLASRRHWHQHDCNPTRKTILQFTGLTVPTYGRALARLIEVGLVSVSVDYDPKLKSPRLYILKSFPESQPSLADNYTYVWDWIINLRIWREIKGAPQNLYIALAYFRNWDTHTCWPNKQTLCDITDLDGKSYISALKKLQEKGLVRILEKGSKSGKSTLYQLAKTPGEAAAFADDFAEKCSNFTSSTQQVKKFPLTGKEIPPDRFKNSSRTGLKIPKSEVKKFPPNRTIEHSNRTQQQFVDMLFAKYKRINPLRSKDSDSKIVKSISGWLEKWPVESVFQAISVPSIARIGGVQSILDNKKTLKQIEAERSASILEIERSAAEFIEAQANMSSEEIRKKTFSMRF